MHILRPLKFLSIFFILLVHSCKPQGPLTPGDAFHTLKNLVSTDPGALYQHLSRGSRDKLNNTVKIFSAMNDRQLAHLSENYGGTPERFKNINARDFFRLYITSDKNEIKRILRYNIVGIDISGKSASVNVENGMKLLFTLEGPYWKLDINDL